MASWPFRKRSRALWTVRRNASGSSQAPTAVIAVAPPLTLDEFARLRHALTAHGLGAAQIEARLVPPAAP
ncbi:hypothetical protein ACFVV7_23505 [Streptomyces globisporus]|uniref:hypothetical protein n=1 Tax=Streptomyces globisporus TaxID=1908 RepID=UPI0036DC29FC